MKLPFVLFSSPVLTPPRPASGPATTYETPRIDPAPQRLHPQQRPTFPYADAAFFAAGAVGVLLRVVFILAANPNDLTFHSGGSDSPSYVLLAQNLLHHAGFAYDGFPTAVRPPGYPLLLAAAMQLFGAHYIVAIRILQFALGLATIAICANVAKDLAASSGVPSAKSAARGALLIGLFLPTLIFTTAQLLTECVAAFLTAMFLKNLVRQRHLADTRSAWLMGAAAGLESMFRFNAAALPLFAAAAILTSRSVNANANPVRSARGACRVERSSRVLRLVLALALPLLIVSPWLLRNELAFHGQVLYSTQSGPNAVQGVLTSSGRTQPGDYELLQKNLGWELHQIETNQASRAQLPSEAVLDRAALAIVPKLWAAQGFHAIPLLAKKLADFWLSADQLAATSSLPFRERALRAAGVVCYWLVLAAAVIGGFRLRRTHPAIAALFLLYASTLTLLHLPLVMNTRLRIPLLDPMIVILASLAFCSIRKHGRTSVAP